MDSCIDPTTTTTAMPTLDEATNLAPQPILDEFALDRVKAIPIDQLVNVDRLSPNVKELIQYYQRKLDAHDHERKVFLQKMRDVQGGKHSIHKLQYQLMRTKDHIFTCQKAISDANIHLHAEREQVLRLSAENDALHIQEQQDRKRIQHLLALSQPVAEETTYFVEENRLSWALPGRHRRPPAPKPRPRSARPVPFKRKKKRNTSLDTSVSSLDTTIHSIPPSPDACPPPNTLSPPPKDDNKDVLKQIITMLRAQLDRERTASAKRLQALVDDRTRREGEIAKQRQHYMTTLQAREQDMQKLQKTLDGTVRDYLEERHAHAATQRHHHEKKAQWMTKVQHANKAVQVAKQKANKKVHQKEKESTNFVQLFRTQARSADEELAIVRAQYDAAQHLFEKRTQHLESQLATETKRHAALKSRRRLEMEGFHHDVKNLRSKLAKTQTLLAQRQREADRVLLPIENQPAKRRGRRMPAHVNGSRVRYKQRHRSPPRIRQAVVQEAREDAQAVGEQDETLPVLPLASGTAARLLAAQSDMAQIREELDALAGRLTSAS